MLFTAAIVVAFASATHAFYANTPVVELTASNFNQVYDDTNVWMIEFYAPWCGHCQRLTPEYIKAAKNVEGLAKLGAINCDEQANQPICGPFGVRGFPTLKVLPWNAKNANDAIDYQGARSGASIAKHVLGQIANHVKKVSNGATHDDFVATEGGKVLLFSAKPAVTTLYKALAQQFKNRLSFAQAAMSDSELAAQYNVGSAPALLVLPADGGEPVRFDGKLKPLVLGKFLSGYAPELKTRGGKGGSKKSSESAEPARPKTPVQDELWRIKSAADYKARCQERPGTCVIGLFDPLGDHFDTYRDALAAVLDEHKGGAFTLVWLDAFEQEGVLKALGLYGQDLPQLVVINDGKRAWNRFIGSFDAERIGKYLGKIKNGVQSVQKLGANVDVAGAFVTEKSAAAKDEL